MTPGAFENAIRVDMAMGGSTNTVLHIPAIAREASIDIPVMEFDRISRETPNLCSIIPAGPSEMADIHAAGGVPAVMHCLQSMLQDNPTVHGRSIAQVAKDGSVQDPEIIRGIDRPFHAEGGIAVLSGNIATSAVIKQTALHSDVQVSSGPARVFVTESDLLDAIQAGRIAEGDVIVLPFQGPAGGPGMPEMLTPTDAIKGAGFTRVALITDGRFSGATSGLSIGHVEMEAFNGGPIAAIRDGDIIDIDVPARSLNVRLSPEEIRDRLRQVRIPERRLSRMLENYRKAYTGINCYGRQG
jgi:dihydroxy-acid dehydratase